MSPPGEWFRRLGYLLTRRRVDEVLRQEMEAHREMLDEPARFGNAQRLREEAHDAWGWRWLDNLSRDVRLAIRQLTRTPGYTVTAIAALALGFVVVASTIAVANAYLLRALPYAGGNRLYHVMYAPPGPWEPRGMDSLDWPSVQDVVEFPVTAASDTFYLSDGAYAEPARVLMVGRPFVEGLGVHAALGRSLGADDWRSDADVVGLIGFNLWRTRYGSDPTILGRIIRAASESQPNGTRAVRVVGVLPESFYFGRDSQAKVDVLLPLTRPARTYMVRLRDGVTQSAAERRLTDAVRAIANDLPADWTGVHLESVRGRYVAEFRTILIGSTAASMLVLALVTVDVAVLTLLRAARRQKEIAIRLALGSGRWHLARMLIVETGLVAGVGLAVGVVASRLVLGVLASTIQTQLGRAAPGGPEAFSIDGTSTLVLGGAAMIVALSLALVPLVAPWRRRMGEILGRERGATTEGGATRRVRATLLACQVAGTLVLLVAGALLFQSTRRMVRTDLGFEPGRLVRSRVALRSAGYADAAAFYRFYERFTAAASARTQAPIVFSTWPPFVDFPVQAAETPELARASAGLVRAGGGYFAAIGARVAEGRDFSVDDERTDAPVAIVSETLARTLWATGSALGRHVRAIERTQNGPTPGPWRTIVGVVTDVRQNYFDRNLGDLYLPYAPGDRGRYGSFYVRTATRPSALWPVLRTVAAEIDPTAIVSEPIAADTENQPLVAARFLTRAAVGLSLAALLLAVMSLYGVTAYTLQQREKEIALRVALGAPPRAIRGTFLRDLGMVLAAGLGFGLTACLILSRFLEHRLYGVPPRDLVTLGSMCLLVATVGLLAACRPIARASHVNPASVLNES
ncbi:MAG TPA: ABC transporter permease [Vicinamibacterales bacterium]|jgi:predicted permease|nr:ABC transporter permease [Vicinamibacterales bacterium]